MLFTYQLVVSSLERSTPLDYISDEEQSRDGIPDNAITIANWRPDRDGLRSSQLGFHVLGLEEGRF